MANSPAAESSTISEPTEPEESDVFTDDSGISDDEGDGDFDGLADASTETSEGEGAQAESRSWSGFGIPVPGMPRLGPTPEIIAFIEAVDDTFDAVIYYGLGLYVVDNFLNPPINPGENTIFFPLAPISAAGGAKPFAMGLTDEGLEAFAKIHSATTWKQLLDPASWKIGVLEKLADPKTQVHFNLNGVNVWQGVSRAAAGKGGPTDWELLMIQQNPQFWGSIQFWQGGVPVANPFK